MCTCICIAPRREHSKPLSYGMHSQGISQFYLHIPHSSTNRMNHTSLLLPSHSWSSLTKPEGIEGWVGLRKVTEASILQLHNARQGISGKCCPMSHYGLTKTSPASTYLPVTQQTWRCSTVIPCRWQAFGIPWQSRVMLFLSGMYVRSSWHMHSAAETHTQLTNWSFTWNFLFPSNHLAKSYACNPDPLLRRSIPIATLSPRV